MFDRKKLVGQRHCIEESGHTEGFTSFSTPTQNGIMGNVYFTTPTHSGCICSVTQSSSSSEQKVFSGFALLCVLE